MLKFAIALLFGLLALNLNGTLAESDLNCPLKDPPNQCGGFCLIVLTPLINHLTIPHNVSNSSDASKANEVLVRQYTMERQLSALQEKQTSLGAALDAQEGRLDINQQNLTGRLYDLESQLWALQATLHNVEIKIKYLGFEQIGSKYFYIEKVSEKNWPTASKTCRNMGGHLADIKDEADLAAIQANLEKDTHYWLGINDLGKEGEFLSMSTGQPATFLKWASGRPSQLDTSNCVFLYNGEMYDYPCNYTFRFICQTEEEVLG